MTKDKAHVDEIFTRTKHKSTPILLKFQNGELKNSHKDTTTYFPAKCESDLSAKCAVVVTSGNVYTGPITESPSELVDSYICIRNKTTDKIRILPIDQATLINHLYEEKEKTSFESLTKEAARDRLTQMFGGRKDIRMLNNRARNKVSVDILRDQLETTVENADVEDSQDIENGTEDIINSIRPKFDQEAKTLKNVFDIYDVIPLQLINRLDEEVDVIINTDIDDIPLSSDYLKTLLLELKIAPKSDEIRLKMKIIVYMDALLTLLRSGTRNLDKLEMSQITEKVENDIRLRFTSKEVTKSTRTTYTNEKALCYFLVLALLISEKFEIDLKKYAPELGMSNEKIIKYGNLVHATCKAKTHLLSMKLPSKIKPRKLVGKKRKYNAK